mmetsp:Transcript_248/g.602  ORF Transcript_248/g.602 Transcript_248/m.602 type:complete len:128 (+) Transcript_248:552-935(+)
MDTHALLSQLVDHAATVMKHVVDNVMTVCTLPPHVMVPPPAPQVPKDTQQREPRDLRVVSPELASSYQFMLPPPACVEPLNLDHDDDDNSETDTSSLSPESCANIVDFVIGEVNQDLIRPTKRVKHL